MTQRVLVTGAAGMLGSQVLLAASDDVGLVGTDLREAHGVDVTINRRLVEAAARGEREGWTGPKLDVDALLA